MLWKLPRFTSLVAPEQTKGYNYGRRGAFVAASAPTANRHCLCGLLFSSSVMFLGDLEGNLYSDIAYRESGIYLCHRENQAYEVVGHTEGRSLVVRPLSS